MVKHECSLREKKYARTKIALMNIFIERLKNCKFNDISIQEICKDAEVSDGTFFNYFPEKVDIVNYYRRLFFLKVIWGARKEAPGSKRLVLINTIFEKLADGHKDNINVIHQILSIMILQKEGPKPMIISDIEKHLAFPDCAGIEDTPSIFIDDFFGQCLKGALKNGELPKGTNINDVLISLLTIMSGTLFAVKLENIKDRRYHYRRQLQLLWKGLGVKV